MKTRVLAGAVIVAAAVVLTYGMGFAAGKTGPATPGRGGGQQWTWEDMDKMHEQMMEQMRARFGDELADQCDAMHDQMQGMMGSGAGGMMGPGGAGMQQHHPDGMMGGSGSGGSGGMMGGSGGSGGMMG